MLVKLMDTNNKALTTTKLNNYLTELVGWKWKKMKAQRNLPNTISKAQTSKLYNRLKENL